MDATSFARLIDAIPIVDNDAVRGTLFPNPSVNQRVHNQANGYIERWDGSLWLQEIRIQSKGIGDLDVRAFGAKPGNADNAAFIQAALTEAGNAGGGRVLLTGMFPYQSMLTVPDNVELAGLGWGTGLQMTNLSTSNTTWGIQYGDRCTLRDFKLLGPGALAANQFGNGGAVLGRDGGAGSSDALIERLWITEWNRTMVNLNAGSLRCIVRHNYINRSGCEGIFVPLGSHHAKVLYNVIEDVEYNGIDSNANATQIEGNRIVNVGHLFDASGPPTTPGDSRGILVYANPASGSPLDKHIVKGNYIENARGENIHVYTDSTGSMTKVLVEGNRSTASGKSGIVIEAATSTSTSNHHEVVGNFSWANTEHGIYVHGSSDNHVADNKCWSNTIDGIRVFDGGANQALRNSLVANRCIGNTGFGIKVQDVTAADTYLAANVLLSNTAGPLSDSGNATRKFGNKTSTTTLGGNILNELDGQLRVVSTSAGAAVLDLGGGGGGGFAQLVEGAITAFLAGIRGDGAGAYGGTLSNHAFALRTNNTDRVSVSATGVMANLFAHVRKFAALAYSAAIATDASVGNLFKITATNGTAFTIANPTNLTTGQTITYDILNSSGGALGVITWGSAGLFLLAGAFTNPANTKRRTIEFYYDGTNLVEVSRAAADI